MNAALRSLACVLFGLVAIGARAATTVTSDPSPIVLGRATSAQLTLHLDPELAAAKGNLRLNVNVGVVDPPETLPDGSIRVLYTAPTTKFPQMAVLGVWRDGSALPVEFVRLPLFGMTKIDAASKPGTEVSARVGDEVFGPTTANAKGQAMIPVVVPPGTKDTVLLAKVSGVQTQRTVALGVPPYNRLAAAIVSVDDPAAGIAQLDIFYDIDGEVDPRNIRVRPSHGTANFETVSGSRVRYRCKVPPNVTATFTISVENDPVAKALVELKTVPARPGAVGSNFVANESAFQFPTTLAVGVRVGVTHSLAAMVTPRFGIDALAPMDLGPLRAAAGITIGYGSAGQTLMDPVAGGPLARAELALLPITWRFSISPLRFSERGGVVGGAGLLTTFARYQLRDAQGAGVSQDVIKLTAGLLLFAGATWDMGPGQAFGELVLSWAAIEDTAFRAPAGGLGIELGYRFDVFKRAR